MKKLKNEGNSSLINQSHVYACVYVGARHVAEPAL